MESLNSFKSFMSGNDVPTYINRYCQDLDNRSWERFYEQMKEPLEFVKDTETLIYVLKWILKYDFDDLSYAVFFQGFMDPEGTGDLIMDSWWQILCDRYWSRIEHDMSGIACKETSGEVTEHDPGWHMGGGGSCV